MIKNNITIILGANSGVAISLIDKLIYENYYIIGIYNNNKENLVKYKENNIELFKCDLTNSTTFNNLMLEIILKYGDIHSVISTLSRPIFYKKIFDLEYVNFNNHFEIQVKPIIDIIKSLNNQIKRKVQIKFIAILSEVIISNPPKYLSDYTTSKYALLGFCKSMAIELSEYKSTFNMISPGLMDTKLTKTLPSKLLEFNENNNPLKKLCSTDDVSNAIHFLLSDKTNYINGANIVINGGSTIL